MKISFEKGLRLITVAAVLCAAIAVIGTNVQSSMMPAVSYMEKQTDSVARFRTEREQLRSMQKAQLNDIAHSTTSEAETADMAKRQLLELYANEEQEQTLEGILSMRGFIDPIVTVHSGSVNVLIRAEVINREQSSIILDLVSRETGVMAGDIKIIPIN